MPMLNVFVLIAIDAAPPETCAVPSALPPSVKVTVPVGWPEAATRLAVKVTLCPIVGCVTEAWSRVVVSSGVGADGGVGGGAGWATTIVTAAEVEAVLDVSPPYTAMML